MFNSQHIDIKDGHIFINVDDELSIKSMHTHLFKIKGINLISCSTEHDLKSIMIQIYSQFNSESKPKVVILLDNVLDDTTGLELYNNLKHTQIKFNLDILWILVSSTEDKNTILN